MRNTIMSSPGGLISTQRYIDDEQSTIHIKYMF